MNKNSETADPQNCQNCSLRERCPYFKCSLYVKMLYCDEYYNAEKVQAKRQKNSTEWELMTKMPLPYYPN